MILIGFEINFETIQNSWLIYVIMNTSYFRHSSTGAEDVMCVVVLYNFEFDSFISFSASVS